MTPKLLLADDSVTIQRVIELTFADEPVQVLTAGDGREAIEQIQAQRPDIVLADVGMPERTGYDVAAFVKDNPEYAHIPVLLLTGAFEPVDEARAHAVGCAGVLVKPFEPQMVISRVRELLSGTRAAASDSLQPAPAPPRGGPAARELDRLDSDEPAKPAPGGGSLEDYFDRLDAALSGTAGPAPAVVTNAFEPVDRPAQEPHAVQRQASEQPVRLSQGPATPAASKLSPGPSPAGSTTWPQPPVPERAAPAAELSGASTPGGPSSQGAERPGPAPSSFPARIPLSPPAVEQVSTVGREGAPFPAFQSVPSLRDAFAALLAAEQGGAIAPAPISREAVPEEVVEDVVRRVVSRLGSDDTRRMILDTAERLVREEIERIKAR